MSLADRTPPKAVHGMPCSVGKLLEELPPAESDALKVMLDARGEWSSTAIYDVLVEEGHKVGYQTVGRHRARSCRCGK